MTDTKHSADLHDNIMRLEIPVDPKIPADASVMLAYKMGHRDARHAAAELAIAAAAPKPALTAEKVIPLSVLDEIAQVYAESVPGPGGYPCTESEKKAFKQAFLQRWMPKAIEAASSPNAALVSALQMLLNCDKHGSFGARVEAVNKANAALAAAGVQVAP